MEFKKHIIMPDPDDNNVIVGAQMDKERTKNWRGQIEKTLVKITAFIEENKKSRQLLEGNMQRLVEESGDDEELQSARIQLRDLELDYKDNLKYKKELEIFYGQNVLQEVAIGAKIEEIEENIKKFKKHLLGFPPEIGPSINLN